MLIPYWKLVQVITTWYLVRHTQMPHVFLAKVQMFTPFFGDRSWNLARVFYEPLTSGWRMFFFFSPEILDRPRPKLPPKNTKQNIWYPINKRKKTKREKKTFVNERLGRGSQNTCAKFQGLTSNGCWTKLGRSLNRLVAPYCIINESPGTEQTSPTYHAYGLWPYKKQPS